MSFPAPPDKDVIAGSAPQSIGALTAEELVRSVTAVDPEAGGIADNVETGCVVAPSCRHDVIAVLAVEQVRVVAAEDAVVVHRRRGVGPTHCRRR